MSSIQPLELQHVIGLNGKIYNGFILHPNNIHVIYVLGSTIILRDLHSNQQSFLHLPHEITTSNNIQPIINSIALSATGKYLCVGTSVSSASAVAPVVVYDLENFSVSSVLSLHHGSITDISISVDEKYIATLGGVDDNKLIIWSIDNNYSAVVGATAANDITYCVRWTVYNTVVTCGSYNLRYWNFNVETRKLIPTDASLGQIKRVFTSLVVLNDRVYSGTMSGDLFEIMYPTVNNNSLFLLKRNTMQHKKHYQLGVTCLALTGKNNLIVGAGDGTLAVVRTDSTAAELKLSKSIKLSGTVTSIQLNSAADHVFVTTNECNTYCVSISDLKYELRYTSHRDSVQSVAFPQGYSELFLTASQSDLRVWQLNTTHELLRITVPNAMVTCGIFSNDGRCIISGWSDGAIRGFGPQSGKLLFTIPDACSGGVSALCVFHKPDRSSIYISGSFTGQLRIWSMESLNAPRMLLSLKEHQQSITSINCAYDNTELVTSSLDGSCIIWDTTTWLRKFALVQPTQFLYATYHTDSTQLLTLANDRKITYWDVTDGTPIRVIDSCESNPLQSLVIDSLGTHFVTGGKDQRTRVWNYDSGLCEYTGTEHGNSINSISITPNNTSIVVVDQSGGIYIYSYPIQQNQSEHNHSITDENAVHHTTNVIGSPSSTQKLATTVSQPLTTTHRNRAVLR